MEYILNLLVGRVSWHASSTENFTAHLRHLNTLLIISITRYLLKVDFFPLVFMFMFFKASNTIIDQLSCKTGLWSCYVLSCFFWYNLPWNQVSMTTLCVFFNTCVFPIPYGPWPTLSQKPLQNRIKNEKKNKVTGYKNMYMIKFAKNILKETRYSKFLDFWGSSGAVCQSHIVGISSSCESLILLVKEKNTEM